MGVSSPLVSSTIGVAEGFSSDVPASPAAVVGAEASIERDSSMNWRKLFGADSNQPLQFFPPKVQDGEVVHSVGDDSFKKKVALAEGTSRMNGEVVWVPKKISLVHVQGKCSDEGVNIVAGDVSVIDDSVNGKSVIAGSSNRFVVLVDVDHAQVSSTSHVVGEASVRVSMAENDASGQAAEHVTRQPREAAKAVARIVQDFKAKKQNKGGARKHNKGGRKVVELPLKEGGWLSPLPHEISFLKHSRV
ncbi:hypothetical protein V6N11_078178 [Hibiscus sabdariffa]|uniref:Uncharacterized protein n=1 Tax=Hibiscus sabdariffa TaxID=183260 RepID=A0ABR2TF97_9ROSI